MITKTSEELLRMFIHDQIRNTRYVWSKMEYKLIESLMISSWNKALNLGRHQGWDAAKETIEEYDCEKYTNFEDVKWD